MITDRLSKDLRCFAMVPYVPLVYARTYTLVIKSFYRNDRLVSMQYYHIHEPSPHAAPLTPDACVQSAGITTEADAGALAVPSQLVSGRVVRGGPHYAPLLTSPHCIATSYAPTRRHVRARGRCGADGLLIVARGKSAFLRNQTAVQRSFVSLSVSLKTFQENAISS
jgi:hypothetical protein